MLIKYTGNVWLHTICIFSNTSNRLSIISSVKKGTKFVSKNYWKQISISLDDRSLFK